MGENEQVGQGHPRRWTILFALYTALLVIVVDNTVLNVALPSIARVFEAGTGGCKRCSMPTRWSLPAC